MRAVRRVHEQATIPERGNGKHPDIRGMIHAEQPSVRLMARRRHEFDDLPDIAKIRTLLRGLGSLAAKYDQRLSFHPGHFNVLGSPNPNAVAKTTKELNQHGQIMDMIGLPRDHRASINIHCNGVYEGKAETLARWRENCGSG